MKDNWGIFQTLNALSTKVLVCNSAVPFPIFYMSYFILFI